MTTIWFDGQLMPLEEARISAFAHTLHYGVGVFEGIRSYKGEGSESAVFRLGDHLRRFEESARICNLRLPYSRTELERACLDVLEASGLRDGYLRPLAFQDDGKLGGLGSSPTVKVMIAAQPWGAYLGEEGLTKGIRVRVCAYRRGTQGSFLSRAKICGQYVGSTLAKREAVSMGLDEALLMDEQGYVCEGSGENLFMVRDGRLVTPPANAAILPGITRHTVMHLARQLRNEVGLTDVAEELIPRDALLIADEVFLTGTAAEVTPVREIDGRTIGAGSAGPVTRRLQRAFFDLVRGGSPAPAGWRTPFAALVR